MTEFLKENKTHTENGAVTYGTTASDCLDLFATVGAIRYESDEEITKRFLRAFTEDKTLAMKLLFFARDIRGGLGERRVFRTCLRWLAHNAPDSARKNLHAVAEYGRYDDLLALFGTPLEYDALALIRDQLRADITAMNEGGSVSLLGKWLPSVNASNPETVKAAKKIARFLKIEDRAYRKTLVRLRKHLRILENNLRERDYTFDYEKQPSKALFKYREAFWRNDFERYGDFLNRVGQGRAKLHTDTLVPYEVIAPFFERNVSEEESTAIDTTWNALPPLASEENALVVVDGSGSMYGGRTRPITVALSLGIYFAEQNRGKFHNHFITFSENPRLVEIKGETILEKVRYCASFNEVANTNLRRVFELILDTAIEHDLPQEELPKTLYIVSDMEFDCCTRDASLTNFESAKRMFEEAGYTLPRVVFWNVESRNNHQPVTKNEQGVALVSGCTPKLFSMVADGRVSDMTPYDLMLEILNSARYDQIAA